VLLGALLAAATFGLTSSASATRINSSADPALAGAFLIDFNDASYTNTYFTSQTFTVASGEGFTITPDANDLYLDDTWCVQFGSTGNCLNTTQSSGGANDDFEVVFAGTVSAFGFVVNALDADWTIETFNEAGVSLNIYTLASQSPGLTGFNRQGYFGATESEVIKSFTVSSAGSDWALIDDFSFVSLPEPGTAILLGLGLVTLGSTRRRES
jgi:hypothetical protein